MALVVANRVRVTTATTGTGVISLGSATTGYRTFATAGVLDGSSVPYTIEDAGGAWECGVGTYTASGSTLSRSVIASSAGGTTPINLSGAAQVFISLLAENILESIKGVPVTDWRNGLVEDAKLRPYIPMIGAAADGFFDQSGIDVANSVNAIYDSTNKLYATSQVATTVSTTGNAIADSTYSSSYPASYAFDGNTSTAWATAKSGTAISGAAYIGQDFGAGNTQVIGQIVFVSSPTSGGNISSALVQYADTSGSGLGSWTTVATVALNTAVSTTTTIPIPSGAGSHRAWRLLANANLASGAVWNVAEATMQTLAYSALDLRSATFSAGFTPTKGSLFFILNVLGGGPINVGTNLVASLSQDGGSTYTTVPLTLSGTTLAGYPIYEANGVTLGGTGTQPKWRLQTSGGLGLQERGAYFKVQ